MSVTLHPLPLVQNWDCQACGTCCKEYHVGVSEEERRRIEAQGWEKEPEFADLPLFLRQGPPWRRRYELNRRSDGSCIFLSEQGRCRIHERFGSDAKPLPCRLYPFVLVPVGDEWRVGAHLDALEKYTGELIRREGLGRSLATPVQLGMEPPPLHGRQRVDWNELERSTDTLLSIVRNPRDRMERRLRKCLALARLCRQARFEAIAGNRLKDFLSIVTQSLDAEVPADPASLAPPGWIGRVLFRQALAVYTRKDQGPKRGISSQGRVALFRAACRFALGRGPIPKVHAWLPDVTLEQCEVPVGPLPPDAEQLLERYYSVKVESMQFCGRAYFGVGFWEGVEALAITYPVILWLRRAFGHLPPAEAITQALTIADDHFGFNRALGWLRQRLSFHILAQRGELDRLIAWYSR
jgi:lysine-N-methylase